MRNKCFGQVARNERIRCSRYRDMDRARVSPEFLSASGSSSWLASECPNAELFPAIIHRIVRAPEFAGHGTV